MTAAIAFPGRALTPEQRSEACRIATEQFAWFVAQGYSAPQVLEALRLPDLWPSWDLVEGRLHEAALEMVEG